jgi:hypothetical protein
MKTAVLLLETLSDDALLARLDEVVKRGRRVEAELIWHLAEVDRRRLYRREACQSMFVYATSRLRLSEAEAFLRITVARVSRRFPSVLTMLADGRLHLSAIAKLAPHLRDDDGEALLARAVGRSKREIEMLVAELAPRPDAPAGMRRLPAPAPPELRPGGVGSREVTGEAGVAAAQVAAAQVAAAPVRPALPPARAPAAVVAPLAPSRYRVQFTAGSELRDKIARAQALLRHQVPSGDLAEVFDRAVTLLLGHLERTRFAATAAPRKSVEEADPTPSSRHIPAPIRRAVWQRDGGQCTFHDAKGRRCPARERLEFHHDVPFARGGDHSESNVRLVCSSHNAYQAELDYSAAFMAACRREPALESAGQRTVLHAAKAASCCSRAHGEPTARLPSARKRSSSAGRKCRARDTRTSPARQR